MEPECLFTAAGLPYGGSGSYCSWVAIRWQWFLLQLGCHSVTVVLPAAGLPYGGSGSYCSWVAIRWQWFLLQLGCHTVAVVLIAAGLPYGGSGSYTVIHVRRNSAVRRERVKAGCNGKGTYGW
jgi:hypothetical protein